MSKIPVELLKSRAKELDVTLPEEGRVIMKDRYWHCIDGNPKRALFYRSYDSPQCNHSRAIAERLPIHPDAKVIFIETAYVPNPLLGGIAND